MRFLMVVRKMSTGGLQQQTVSFVKTAVAKGHEAHLLILKSTPNELEIPQGVIVHRVNIKNTMFSTPTGICYYLFGHLVLPLICAKSKDFGTGLFFGKWFTYKFLPQVEKSYGQFDYIFIRAQGAFDLLSSYNDDRCYRYVDGNPYNYHDRLPFINPIGDYINRRTYGGNNKFICVSSFLAQKIKDISQTCNGVNQITTFRNFLNIAEIKEKSLYPLDEQQQSQLPDNYIVSVGRLVNAKQQELAIQAMQYLPEDLKLVIVGGGSTRSKLQDWVKKLKLESRVIFVGNQVNPYPYIKHAKALVHTSAKEGFGLIFVEALILDTPIIAMESLGGMRDILNGEILSNQIVPRDVTALANKIAQTLANPYHTQPQT